LLPSLYYLQADTKKAKLEQDVARLEMLADVYIDDINNLRSKIKNPGSGVDIGALEAKLELANSDLRRAETKVEAAKEVLEKYLQQIEQNSSGKSSYN